MDQSPVPFSALFVALTGFGAYDLRNSSGSLAMFTAMRHASSRVSSWPLINWRMARYNVAWPI